MTAAATPTTTMPATGALMSGNEAVAWGARDAGVGFVAAFPGGPTTGLVYSLAEAQAAGQTHPRVQWSLNEKVAVEAASGAAMGGVRSLAVMKHFGANNAADMIFAAPLMFIPGLVIVVGDDPNGHTSHSEQDTRPYPIAADMPCLEPSSPQEAYELIGHAFELSERLSVPVYFRLVKWLCDWSAPVRRTDLARPSTPPAWDDHHFQSRPIVGQHERLHATLSRVADEASGYGADRVEGPTGPASAGIVAAGNAYRFAVEALDRLSRRESTPVLKLSTINPLPADLAAAFLDRCERVLVVEEIEPVVEDRLAALAQRRGLTTEITGRASGALPVVGELTPTAVTAAVSGFCAAGWRPPGRDEVVELARRLPARPAAPVAGNPHRPTMYALGRFIAKTPGAVLMGDVGEAAAMGRPYMKAHSAMGAGIGMAVGAALADPDATVITVVGDGTIYGFALNGIADAVYNKANLVLLVLDNATMESTGGQSTPTSAAGLRGVERPLDIAAALQALGVAQLRRVDARDMAAVEDALREAAAVEGVAAVLAEGRHDQHPRFRRVHVDSAAAQPYRDEIARFACPALGVVGGEVRVDDAVCVRCGDCRPVAPGAITVVGRDRPAGGPRDNGQPDNGQPDDGQPDDGQPTDDLLDEGEQEARP